MKENTLWDDLRRMQAELDYMMHKTIGRMRQKSGMYRYPHSNIREDGNEIVVEVELPGMKKENIKINSDEYGIEIRAERGLKIEKRGKEGFSRQESQSKFYRRIALPAEADYGRLKATYNEGILELRMPRKKGKFRKNIEIK